MAGFDGGGIYCDVSNLMIMNNMIDRNRAGSDGAGIYFWGAIPEISNSTITGNIAEENGGGIYCSFQNDITIKNTILWNNDAISGKQIYIGSESEECTLTISYTDVEGGDSPLHVGPGCDINWGPGIIYADPLFAAGPVGRYFLCQIAAGQKVDSPCVDTGDPLSDIPVGTTRTDGVQDSWIIDMGYHYPLGALH